MNCTLKVHKSIGNKHAHQSRVVSNVAAIGMYMKLLNLKSSPFPDLKSGMMMDISYEVHSLSTARCDDGRRGKGH